MRVLSSSAHRRHISSIDDERVIVDDRVLPAARHLTGEDAFDVLQTTVRAAGGELVSARPSQVQYRPGAELVVRYEAVVAWAGSEPVAETLMAATTSAGPIAGTVPLTAVTELGELSVGVWRWPFDPVLVGLADAVTAAGLGALLDVDPHELRLEVVAYRPTERAVVRAVAANGTTTYVKVVRPSSAAALVERHHLLDAAGVPVPRVIASDVERGLVAMVELRGDTLRSRLKAGTGPWPEADEYRALRQAFAAADIRSQPPVRRRVADAIGHAKMLSEIVPDRRELIDELCEHLHEALQRSTARPDTVIHGDLYEAQLVLDPRADDGRIGGVLDIDDVGPGDPLDDLATVLGHLRYRATTARTAPAAIGRYADRLRAEFADDVDPVELDVVTGAVMVGLATGPFRIQQDDWAHAVCQHLDTAAELIRPRAVGRPRGGMLR